MAEFPVLLVVMVLLEVRGLPVEEFMGLEVPKCWSGCSSGCSEKANFSLFSLCHCDSACPYFGDCCQEYFHKCLDMSFGDTLNFLYDIKRLKASPEVPYNSVVRASRYSTCAQIQESRPKPIFLINKCPDELNDDIVRRKCENQTTAFPFDVPVFNRWNVNEIFANVFCAVCHSLPRRDIIVWDSELQCFNPCYEDRLCTANNTAEIEQRLATREMKQKYCKTYLSHHLASKIRKCSITLPGGNCLAPNNTSVYPIGPNQLTHSDLDLVCNSYISTVQLGGLYVRNVHCLTCTKNKIYNATDIGCSTTGSTILFPFDREFVFRANISAVMMSYTFTNPFLVLRQPSFKCKKSQTANVLLERCEEDPCADPNWVKLQNNGCIALYEPETSLSNTTTKHYLSLRLYVSVEIEKSDFSQIAPDLETMVSIALDIVTQRHGLRGLHTSVSNASLAGIDTESGPKTKAQNMSYVFTVIMLTQESLTDIMKLTQIIFFELKTLITTPMSLHRVVLSNTETLVSGKCPDLQLIQLANTSLVHTDGKLYAMLTPIHSVARLEDILFSVELDEKFGTFRLQEMMICVREQDVANFTRPKTINCPKIIFTETEYIMINNQLVIGGFVIREDVYVLNETAVLVCLDAVKSLLTNLSVSEDVTGTVKTVSLAAAEGCILITLWSQLVRRDHKDDQSKVHMALMLTLAVAFGLDFADHLTEFLSRLLTSSLLHFFWLVAHFLNASRAGLLLQQSRVNKSVQAKLALCLFTSMALPLAIVLVCIVLEQGPSSVKIGYGSGLIVWWMGNLTSLLVACVIPCGVLLLSCLGIHCHVLRTSRIRGTSTRTSLGSADGLVMTVTLGLLLSVGFGAECTGSTSLGYVYYALHVAMALSFLQSSLTHTVISSLLGDNENAENFTGVDNNVVKRKEIATDM